MDKLRILHLNDLHSHLENFPVIERFFAEKSAGMSDVLRFDLGDNIDRAHPLTEATAGHNNVELMNRLDLTAATLGNNEGLGLTHEMLAHLYDEANFPLLLSNLTNTPFGQGPKIIRTSWGLRVGLIGLTAPYVAAYPYTGWDLRDPFAVLDELLPLDCDFTILLSHLGKKMDEQIAQRYQIDLILSSHTHHLLEHGAEENGTLLAAAGRYGDHVGLIDLSFEGKKLIDAQIEAVPTNTLPRLKTDATEIHGWEVQGHRLLAGTHVAQLPAALPNQFPDFAASQFVAEIFAKSSGVGACVINSGLVVADELPAKISLDTLHEILPHSIRLMKFSLTGEELVRVLTEMIDVAAFLTTQQLHGMGFRGKHFGSLVFYAIKFDKGQFYYENEPVKFDRTYQLVLPDQYVFAWFFPLLKQLGHSEILYPDFLREVVAHFLMEKSSQK